MPAWLVTLGASVLTKVLVPAVVKVLEKIGFITAAQAMIVRFGLDVKETIDNIQVTYEYPNDKQDRKRPKSIQAWKTKGDKQ